MTEEIRDFNERVREVRAEMIRTALARGPLCPADLDPDVWAAVLANYDGDVDWSPGVEYHTEYRDARVAVNALLAKISTHIACYFEVVYGPDWVYRAPETFPNLWDRWLLALANRDLAAADRYVSAIRSSGRFPGKMTSPNAEEDDRDTYVGE